MAYKLPSLCMRGIVPPDDQIEIGAPIARGIKPLISKRRPRFAPDLFDRFCGLKALRAGTSAKPHRTDWTVGCSFVPWMILSSELPFHILGIIVIAE